MISGYPLFWGNRQMGKGFSHTKYFCTKGATQTMSAVPQMHELHVSTFHRSAAAPLQLRRPVPVRRRNTSHVLHIFHHVYHHLLSASVLKVLRHKFTLFQDHTPKSFSGEVESYEGCNESESYRAGFLRRHCLGLPGRRHRLHGEV